MLPELGVCLMLAAQPTLPPRFVPVQAFTLAWTHSIEKTRWEEDYQVVQDAQGRTLLRAGQARIRGSGAGMEPPADARLQRDGWYVYQPAQGPLEELRLTRSRFVPDYEWCTTGRCRPLRSVMPNDGAVTLLRPCLAAP